MSSRELYRRFEKIATECKGADVASVLADIAEWVHQEIGRERLADKADATGDCDHKRVSCEEIGCIGHEVEGARAALLMTE